MNKTTIALSALAVAATVSVATAHKKSAFFLYCVAYEQVEDPDGLIITIPFPYTRDFPTHHPGPCTYVAAFAESPFSFYTTYGYIKTTAPGVGCGGTASCPAIRAVQEF